MLTTAVHPVLPGPSGTSGARSGSRPSALRALWTCLCVLALAVLGVPAPAQAAGAAITGTVLMPAGMADRITAVSVTAWKDGRVVTSAHASVGGGFVLDGLEAGAAYALQLRDGAGGVADTWWRADGAHTLDSALAQAVPAPTSGLTWRPEVAVSITGSLAGPPRTGIFLTASMGSASVIPSAYLDAQGEFVVRDLSPRATYQLRLIDLNGDLLEGWVTADGTIDPDRSRARSFSGATTGVVITPTVLPTISGKVQLPAGFDKGAHLSVKASVLEDDGTWTGVQFSSVADDGSFRFVRLEAGRSYGILLDAVEETPGHERLRSGWWQGNAKPLVGDFFDGSGARPIQVGTSGVILPLETTSTQAPVLRGTMRVGSTIAGSRGTWDPSDITTTYRWLRDGRAISGATTPRYTLTRADLGRKISLRVTAAQPGWTTVSATSAPRTIQRLTPRVSVTVPTTATAGRPVSVTVRVTTSGVSATPAGTVKVSYGSRSTTVPLTYAHEGRVRVTLPAMASGTYAVRALFTPSPVLARYVEAKTSATVSLRVRPA